MGSASPATATAVITGAANGIGAAFARRLAADQAQLWLVDRDATALKVLADELTAQGATVALLKADLRERADQDRVIEMIKAIPALDLLVNSAGFGRPGPFQDLSPERPIHFLEVHSTAPVRFCHAALPGMIARRRGAIINVCSLGQFLCAPGHAMYGATKTFLHQFSKLLDADVRRHGITVQALIPGYTKTQFHNTHAYRQAPLTMLPKALWSTPEAVAQASLKALRPGRVTCVPGLLNGAIAVAMTRGLVPQSLLRRWLV